MKKIFPFLFLLLFLMAGSAAAQYNRYQKQGNEELLAYINAYRSTMGLPLVVYDQGLEEAARLQVLDNYLNKKFKKTGDNLDKLHQNALFPRVRDRVDAVGVPVEGESCAEICYARAGMNNKPLIAAVRPYQSLEQLMFVKYKNSPGHRAIIATPSYTRVGIHTIYDGKNIYNAVVFMTGKPKKAGRG